MAGTSKTKNIIKRLTAALFVILTLAITYLPLPVTWDDIYAAVGLYSQKINNQELLDLTVTYIDVGQGDSILIHTDRTNILIDTGPKGNGQNILSLARALNVKELDYVIITHNHSDHIGSLDEVKRLIPVKNTLVSSDVSKTTNLKFTINDDITLVFLGPVYESDNENNMSLVIKLTYKNKSFLFMGDAESEEEANLIRTYDPETLKADVLKVGHHGSDSASSLDFLQVVQPQYAVISVGADNDYGHPHQATLNALEQTNTQVYRTDRDGTIICTTDGEKIVFHRLE